MMYDFFILIFYYDDEWTSSALVKKTLREAAACAEGERARVGSTALVSRRTSEPSDESSVCAISDARSEPAIALY